MCQSNILQGIEKGQKNPSFEILQALAEALDLSLDNLIMKNLSAEEQDLNQLKTYYHSWSARNAGNAVKHSPSIDQGTNRSCGKDG